MKVLINNVEYHNKYKFSFAIIIPEEQVYSTRIFNKILFLTITKKNHKFSFSMQFAFSASHSSPTIFPFFENRAYTTWKNHVCVCVCVEIGRYLETAAKHGYDLGCGVFPARWPTRSRNTARRSSDFRWSWCARDQNIENVSL